MSTIGPLPSCWEEGVGWGSEDPGQHERSAGESSVTNRSPWDSLVQLCPSSDSPVRAHAVDAVDSPGTSSSSRTFPAPRLCSRPPGAIGPDPPGGSCEEEARREESLEAEALALVHASEQAQLLVEATCLRLLLAPCCDWLGPRLLGVGLFQPGWPELLSARPRWGSVAWEAELLRQWRLRVTDELEMARMDGATVDIELLQRSILHPREWEQSSALKLSQAACTLNPGPDRTLNLARARIAAHDPEGALGSLDAAVSDPTLGWFPNPSWFRAQVDLTRAAAFEQLGCLVASLACLRRSLLCARPQVRPDPYPHGVALAMALALGDRAGAQELVALLERAGPAAGDAGSDSLEDMYSLELCALLARRVAAWRRAGRVPASLPEASLDLLDVARRDARGFLADLLHSLHL